MAMNKFSRLFSFFNSFSIGASPACESADDLKLIFSDDMAILLLGMSDLAVSIPEPDLLFVCSNN